MEGLKDLLLDSRVFDKKNRPRRADNFNSYGTGSRRSRLIERENTIDETFYNYY